MYNLNYETNSGNNQHSGILLKHTGLNCNQFYKIKNSIAREIIRVNAHLWME